MLSLAEPHHYYQYVLSQGVGMGLGMGMMFLPSLAITSHYFRVKRSLAMGCVIAGEITIQSLGDFTNFPPFPLLLGSSLGGVIYPVLLNNLFTRTYGFPWGVR